MSQTLDALIPKSMWLVPSTLGCFPENKSGSGKVEIDGMFYVNACLKNVLTSFKKCLRMILGRKEEKAFQ